MGKYFVTAKFITKGSCTCLVSSLIAQYCDIVPCVHVLMFRNLPCQHFKFGKEYCETRQVCVRSVG